MFRGVPMGQTSPFALPHQDLSQGKPGAVKSCNISVDASVLPPRQRQSSVASDGASLNSAGGKTANTHEFCLANGPSTLAEN